MGALALEDPLSYSTLDATNIPWQYEVIWDMSNKWHWKGTEICLLSGAVGSAKTTLGAFLAINHCTTNTKARVLLGRKALPDLRETLYRDIVELLDADDSLIEGLDYITYDPICRIVFPKTKSEMISRTWADKKYRKFRSVKISMALIEEGTENNEDDMQAYKEIVQRLNRIPHIKKNLMLIMTNPDSPSHWIHREIIDKSHLPHIHVYYSLTEDNPYLDENYIDFLRETLTKQEADRQLRGLWTEIDSERIYYAYDSKINFLRDTIYKLDRRYPVDIMCDFNIAENKPMSWALGQVIPNPITGKEEFHVFKVYYAFTMRTSQLLEEMAADGAFELRVRWGIYGDAAGKHNDTRSKWSDYEIIEGFLENYRRKDGTMLEFHNHVPRGNPPLRRRHNQANGLFLNDKGITRLFLYKGCDWIDEGFRLTKPAKGADHVEDDSLPQQHVTTAITYWTDYRLNKYIDPRKSAMRSKG